MAKIKQDIELYSGEDKQINFDITDEDNQPVDLSGSDAIWVLARISGTPNILITKKVSTSGILISANQYQVLLDDIDTDLLNGTYKHELRMINSTGKDSVLAVGEVRIYTSLTKGLQY